MEVAAAQRNCPHCGAAISSGQPVPADVGATQLASVRLLKALMWSFAVLLATGVVHGIVMGFRFDDVEKLDASAIDQMHVQILFVEAIDTLIIAYVFLACRRALRISKRAEPVSPSAWLLSVPILAVLLLVNFHYHQFLREQLHLPVIQDVLVEGRPWMVFLTICVQPAIVEEAYFRGFALRTLQTVMGNHASVWITALMFAMAHIAMPLSMPYLFLMGGVLGYLRIASGGVWLPIVLHLIHNLVVTLIEAS
jgi:membrane protease YdiL (CAAX protease family)